MKINTERIKRELRSCQAVKGSTDLSVNDLFWTVIPHKQRMYVGDGGCPSVKGQLVIFCLKTSQLTLGKNSAGTYEEFAETKLVVSKPLADVGRGYLNHLRFDGTNIELIFLSKHNEIGVNQQRMNQFAGIQQGLMGNSRKTFLQTIRMRVLLCKNRPHS